MRSGSTRQSLMQPFDSLEDVLIVPLVRHLYIVEVVFIIVALIIEHRLEVTCVVSALDLILFTTQRHYA
ncbi:hypothetical protein QR680_007066 [Steinernema hermaphroditum]|uniref:Uncharacterized protein n=1 Tax=Steinernema hermaphroditum TaxID=289476 RepID=A0AA39HXG0_9BILA|nr:hypothetical protein QR680_007066 [Steinernema hermaphroditum]